MREAYPPIEPFDSGRLRVSDLHEIHYEQCGNPEGRPVVFVHGGPGGGCSADDRRFFDPARWRIVLFDQRGCGRSRPHAELRENTTWNLVEDMEKLRRHLGIESWGVFGGSWGSTLALAYAETHPDRVRSMVLRGIFMLRRSELTWFYQEGASHLYPDVWEDYLAPIPEVERADLMSAYHRRLTSDDPEVRIAAAKAWATWEGATSRLLPDEGFTSRFGQDEFALAFARIECHYFVHGGFFRSDAQLLEDVDRIRHVPAVIVQGRYDVVCPMRSAWDLHRAWPEARLVVVPDAGHNSREPGTLSALIEATDAFADL
ncbi:MAG: prolyl aminopeptidase [Planctomycetota bacterium]